MINKLIYLTSTTVQTYLANKFWSLVLYSVASGLMIRRIIMKTQKDKDTGKRPPNIKPISLRHMIIIFSLFPTRSKLQII